MASVNLIAILDVAFLNTYLLWYNCSKLAILLEFTAGRLLTQNSSPPINAWGLGPTPMASLTVALYAYTNCSWLSAYWVKQGMKLARIRPEITG